MPRLKIFAFITLITLGFGVALVGDAPAGERGKVVDREVNYATNFQTVKIPDVDGHTNHLYEAQLIGFNERFGPAVGANIGRIDVIKGAGLVQGYTHFTYPDGSTITSKWEGENRGMGRGISGSASGEGTWTYIKGTGKYEGIQGSGTYKSYILGPGQWYSDSEGEYTLP